MKNAMLKLHFIIALLVMPITLWAAPVKQSSGQLANPFFWMMLAFIVVLLVIIVGLSNSISQVIQFKRQKKDFSQGPLKVLLVLVMGGMSLHSFAQTSAQMPDPKPAVANPFKGSVYGMDPQLFYALVVLMIIELVVIFVQLGVLRSLLPRKEREMVYLKERKPSAFWERFNRSVAVEKEKDIMFGHEYDGIRELDNNLPPWWIYGFYITVIWGVVYLVHYHISESGPLQEEEYRLEMAEAQAEINAYLAKAANKVDENTFVPVTDQEILKSGKGIYDLNCMACHGMSGEGKVGPNLTDDYWMHGGLPKEIFSSVKYGWMEKGMKAWKDDLTPTDIAKVTSYIMSLRGSNPPGGKGPEGQLVSAAVADSSSVEVRDTTGVK